jgi:hypothetical protein
MAPSESDGARGFGLDFESSSSGESVSSGESYSASNPFEFEMLVEWVSSIGDGGWTNVRGVCRCEGRGLTVFEELPEVEEDADSCEDSGEGDVESRVGEPGIFESAQLRNTSVGPFEICACLTGKQRGWSGTLKSRRVVREVICRGRGYG